MNYEEWAEALPADIKADSLWKMTAYRSIGSISANLAKGYSRGTGKDRARLYDYALSSARESRDWYFKARHILGEAVFEHRLQLLTRVIHLILTMIPQQRGRVLRERPRTYQIACDDDEASEALESLLQKVPVPD